MTKHLLFCLLEERERKTNCLLPTMFVWATTVETALMPCHAWRNVGRYSFASSSKVTIYLRRYFPNTHGIFLGFLISCEKREKNEIPCEKTRKIREIYLPNFLPTLVCPWVLLLFIAHWMVGNKIPVRYIIYMYLFHQIFTCKDVP